MTLLSDSWWKDVEIKAGSRVTADTFNVLGPLVEADDADREILGASFRLPSWIGEVEGFVGPPVNVTITGRTVQWKLGSPRVRVRIEFVDDGQPSTFAGGWLWLG